MTSIQAYTCTHLQVQLPQLLLPEEGLGVAELGEHSQYGHEGPVYEGKSLQTSRLKTCS